MEIKSSVVKYAFLFITLTTTLVLVGIVFGRMQSFDTNSKSYQRAQEAIASWKAGYVDALFVTNSASCPTNTSAIHGFNWPGTVSICACPFTEGVGSYFNIKEGTCSSADISGGCTNHAESNAKDFTLWKGGNKICARVSTNNLFEENTNCPSSTHKHCGSGESKVCVPSSDACPLTYAGIQSSNTANSSLLLTTVSSGDYLVRGNLDGHFPITSFQVQLKKNCKPWCTGNDENSIKKFTFAKGDYQGLIGADPVNPSNIQIVDSQGEKDYFTSNNVLATVSGIPGYPRVTNDLEFQIAAVKSLEWKNKCRTKDGYTIDVITDRLELDDENRIYKAAFGLVLVTWLFVLVIIPLKDYYKSSTGSTNKHICTICMLVSELLKLGALTLVILGLWISNRGYNFFVDALEKDCTSAYGEASILQDYKWTHQVHLILFIVALCFIALCILFDIVHLAKEWKDHIDSKKDKKPTSSFSSEKKSKAKAKANKKDSQPVNVEMENMDKEESLQTDVQVHTNIENDGENLKPKSGEEDKDFIDKCVDSVKFMFA